MDVGTAKTQGKLVFTKDNDPRYDPAKAIPATLNILAAKSKTVNSGYSEPKKTTVIVNGKAVEKIEKQYYPGLNRYDPQNKLSKEEHLKFVLASYNGGEGKVVRALYAAYKGDVKNVPPSGPRYADIEPFLKKETQNYVKQILERANK
jgi:hypothetical protein